MTFSNKLRMPPLTSKENGLIKLDHQQMTTNPEGYLGGLVNQWFSLVSTIEPEEYHRIKQFTDALYELGKTEQKSFWLLNDRMKHPLQKLMLDAKGGGKVTQLLQALQTKVIQIKPPKRSLFSRFKNMFLLLFSWQESTWQMWLERYPDHKLDIADIVGQLEQQKRQLNTDSKMFLGDKRDLQVQLEKLENCVDLMCLMEEKIKDETLHNPKLSADSQKLINDEFLPPVQQRIIELQQQLLIARQAVMTLALFIDQSESQIRGIDQAVYTTTSVIDVTAGIVMVEKGKENMSQLNNNVNDVRASIDPQKLKHARQVIDSVLDQMDEVHHQSQKSTDELVANPGLPTNQQQED